MWLDERGGQAISMRNGALLILAAHGFGLRTALTMVFTIVLTINYSANIGVRYILCRPAKTSVAF